MKRFLLLAALAVALIGCGDKAEASIAVTHVGNFNNTATWTMEQTSDFVLLNTLTNTTDLAVDPETLIDAFAFNTQSAELGIDFYVENFNPDTWQVSAPNGNGVAFQWVGDANTPGDRLGSGDVLTFEIRFSESFAGYDPTDAFFQFLNAPVTDGGGLGGGSVSGQTGISWQQLGADGEGSEFTVDDWDGFAIPEPNSAILFAGLFGLAFARRRR